MTNTRSASEPLNIVVPMAGHGSRFRQAGFVQPKPLIPVCGVPMVRLVIENIRPQRPHHFTFILQREAAEQHHLGRHLQQWAPGCTLLLLDGVTEGALCTVLLAKSVIDNNCPLMIANCDQFIDIDINHYLAHFDRQGTDGMIMTMQASDPKWSYVRLDENGNPCEVVEKQVVSNEATVGIYNYRRGSNFVAAGERMIAKNIRVNNEFYVAPAYNEILASGGRLSLYNVGSEGRGMHGLGTPADYYKFQEAVREKKVRQLAQAA